MRRSHGLASNLDTERRMLRALAAVVGVVLFGTIGFMWFEGWDFWRSLFFTLITITTVGYGDYGLSETGERFTTLLLLFGIGVATYSVGQFVQALVDHHLAWERKMLHKIAKLNEHYIVCGLGRIGMAVCDRLAAAGVTFVAIDSDRDAVQEAVQRGYLAREGDATEDEILYTLGIGEARGIACLTSSDTENIVITLSARELNPDISIIARAEQAGAVRKIRQAGASRVISPIRSGGDSIADTILNPNLSDFLERTMNGGEIRLAEMTVESGSPIEGNTVREYGAGHPSLVFVAIKQADGEAQLRPDPTRALEAGEILIVAGDVGAVAQLHRDSAGSARAA